ncbi:MAG TPA: hypothetical protein VG013_40200 [Gemmataceae bacterium]|jgi:hypothetical protein|nr:hypothetical protein [Gemmataceae bacterium]
MLNTLALVMAVALAPGAKDNELKISNIRSTYSQLGPVRVSENKMDKVLPGDIYFVTWEMEPFKVNDAGELRLSMAMEVTDSKKNRIYKQDPTETMQVNSLGGKRVPAFAHVIIGANTAPGEHTMKVTVEDLAGKRKGSFERKFEILPPGFGMVRLHLSADPDGVTTIPSVGVVGQLLYLNFRVIGADTANHKKAPHVSVTMKVLDENGEPTFKKPVFVESGKEVDKDTVVVPVYLGLVLNRTGTFKVQLTATDEKNKDIKPVQLSFVVTVHDLK